MALLTQFASFFVSPSGDSGVCDELNLFLRSHRIVNIEKYKVEGKRNSGMQFVIEYGSEVKAQTSSSLSRISGTPSRIDYREILTDQEYALFNKLRILRKSISDKNGVLVYTIFTNDQLANMVRKPPQSLKDIQAIPGVGESKVKQYGEFFLNALNNYADDDFETAK